MSRPCFMKDVLASALASEGYEVTEIVDGVCVLEVQGASGSVGDAALLVVDLRRPGISRLVLPELLDFEPTLPVVAITAVGDEETRASAYRLGAAAVLDERGRLEGLLAHIRRTVERHRDPGARHELGRHDVLPRRTARPTALDGNALDARCSAVRVSQVVPLPGQVHDVLTVRTLDRNGDAKGDAPFQPYEVIDLDRRSVHDSGVLWTAQDDIHLRPGRYVVASCVRDPMLFRLVHACVWIDVRVGSHTCVDFTGEGGIDQLRGRA